jgi:hypothetical protein
MGSKMSTRSTERTNPAPRENHTENLRVLRAASFSSLACSILGRSMDISREGRQYSPSHGEKGDMEAMEEEVEEQLARSEP